MESLTFLQTRIGSPFKFFTFYVFIDVKVSLSDQLRSWSYYCVQNFKPHTHSQFLSVLSVSLSVISVPHFILFLISIYIASLSFFFYACHKLLLAVLIWCLFLKIFVPLLPYQFSYWLVVECLLYVRHHLIFESYFGKIQVLGKPLIVLSILMLGSVYVCAVGHQQWIVWSYQLLLSHFS